MRNLRLLMLVLLMNMVAFAAAQSLSLIIPNSHAENIKRITTTSNGNYIASASGKTIIVWEVASHKKIHEINLQKGDSHSEIFSLSITDEIDKIVITSEAGLFCYNILTNKIIFEDGSSFRGAVFSKDGSKVYAVDYETLKIYNAGTWKVTNVISDAIKSASEDYKIYELENDRLLLLNQLGWSIINMQTNTIEFKKKLGFEEDEKLLGFDYNKANNAIIGFTELSIRSFDINNGNIIKNKKLSFSPFGSCVTSNNEVVIFGNTFAANPFKTEVLDANNFSLIKTTSQPAADIPEIIFYATSCIQLPGTNKIVYNNDKQLNFFNVNSGSFSSDFQNKVVDFKRYYYYGNLSQRLLADNYFNFISEDNGIRGFNMESFKPDSYIPAPINSVFSPDGKMMAVIEKKITLKNRTTGEVIKMLPLPAGIDHEVEFFFFNSDNTKLIYTERGKGSLNAIDLNSGLASKVTTLGSSFYECSASFDGKYFACLPFDVDNNYLKVYNLQSKQLVKNKLLCDPEKTDDCIVSIEFLNDSYYLFAAKQKGNISIYKADEPNYNSSFQLQHYNKFRVLGGDIKNNIIAVGEVGQFSVATWNIKLITLEGKLIKEFRSVDHNDFFKVAFSTDDKVMLTSTTQKGVQVWKTDSGELYGTYYFIEKTNEFVFVTPENLFDGSANGMAELYFVRNNKVITLDRFFERFYTPDLLRRKINGEKFFPPKIDDLIKEVNVKILYAEKQRNTNENADYSNTSGLAELTVVATAPGDMVDEIRLFHNGKVVNLATRGLFVTEDDGSDSKKYTINLLPGVNTFRAVAINSQRTESRQDEVTISYNPGNQPVPVKPVVPGNTFVDQVDKNATLHLIVVGINQYQNPSMSLNYALADATAFKQELEKDVKTIITNINTHFVTDGLANKQGIQQTFEEVKQSAKSTDVFIFYYAGHGVIGKDKEFYLVPNDVSDLKNVQAELEQKGIPAKLLQQYAVDIQAQKQLFILDACQSAGAFNEMLSADGDQQKSIAVVSRSTGTHWMAASGAQQFANEFSQLGHGVFTYVLLEALKGSAATDKMITVNGLKNYLQQGVPELMKKYSGTLQYPASYGFGNDFPVEIVK